MKEEEYTAEEFAGKIKEQVLSYVNVQTDLLKARFTEKLALIAGRLISGLVIVCILLFAILFLSILAGFYLSDLLGSFTAGFGIIAAVYVLLLVIVYSFRKKLIEAAVADQVVEIIYRSDEKA